ncbi:hypothetical protein PVNG_06276 [Plasmodium vivax North Korean]|uniref:Variable surface protein n=1 Tax=Plasmodium vivax North Korean TaxID=1035514 RepID=A0A0J9W6H1_PLAVI|nr:hypothetical protein PVNG_06276 [Plasmodium vivax North Korean]
MHIFVQHNFSISVVKDTEYVKILDTRVYRSLGHDDFKNEIGRNILKENLSYHRNNRKGKIGADSMTTYARLKGGELNKLELYRKSYKKKYLNKRGLKKLDCYCENKLFDKFDDVCKIAKMSQNNKKIFTKKLCSKYGFYFLLICLIPFLGLIFPILFKGPRESRIVKLTISKCANTETKTNVCCFCRDGFTHYSKATFHALHKLNIIFIYVLIFLVITVLIYIFIKFIKYERLKGE